MVINGSPALLLSVDGRLDGVLAMRVEHARVTGIYYICNPGEVVTRNVRAALARR
jgi:RNA polymerase sigma-70 factor (ECF subfamily)